MVRKPWTFFVLVAAAGNRVFKAVAQRQSIYAADAWYDSQAAQLIGDVTAVCVVPVTSAVRGRILGHSPPQIAQEACLCLFVAMLSAWLFKHQRPHWRDAFSAAQPTKGACFTEFSPQKGLHVPSLWEPLKWLSRLWQRRRLYLHNVLSFLETIETAICGKMSPLASRASRASAPGSHGVHDWHEALPSGFLMPLEVAACRSPPEVSAAMQRLLADRWWEMEGDGVAMLEPVPEDKCLVVDELPLEKSLPQLLELNA